MLRSQLHKLSSIYHEYPRAFWAMMLVNFIDTLGGSILFPYFALYITQKFSVGMTDVGVLFALFTLGSFIGALPGGALADKFGRKGLIIFSLVTTSLANVLLGFAGTYTMFLIIGFVSGTLRDSGGPAYGAVVADLLPEEKRAQGYGLQRVFQNLAFVLGPVIGGLIAANTYLGLFITDGVVSLAAALLVLFFIPETKPQTAPGEHEETTAESFGGYLRVLKDLPFMLFVMISTLAWMAYGNFNTTLGVYLRDQHGIPEQGYGVIVSVNAVMVVLFQFWTTRKIEKRPPMTMMALGAILMGIGFSLYGFVTAYWLFILAMAIVTVGEMVVIPVSTALVASFSPEDMRGRYNFIFGMSWGIAYGLGPYLAGLVLDNFDPALLWYICLALGVVSALGYYLLHRHWYLKHQTD